jgi:ATP-dependent protease ClpP protease subunit
MKATIHINGVIGKEIDLLGVIRQFKSFKKPSEVEVLINSVGGNVDIGKDIFSYLRELNLPITTVATKAYSIAASIFMAGDIRLLEEGSKKFMIHMPWGNVSGGRKQFEIATKQLKEVEDEFIAFYSIYTEVDDNSVRRLLENETFLSAQEAVDMGLATGTYKQLEAVAYYNNENEKNNIMTKTDKLLQAFSEFLGNKPEDKEEEVKVEVQALVVQDANGEDVSFPDLEEGDAPSEGDKVEAEDGEILMPDGSKVVVKEGVVDSIIPAEKEEEPAEDVPTDADFAKLLEEMEAKIFNKVEAKFTEKEDKMQVEINALRKEVGSTIDNDPKEDNKKKGQSGNRLTNAYKNK